MSVHKRTDPGAASPWQVRWREDGRQRSRAFRTRKEAVQFDAQVQRAVAARQPAPPRLAITLEDWIAEWLRVHGPTWAPSTRSGRATYADRWIAPYLGSYPIGQIARGDVSRWRAAMIRDGASNNTVNHATRVLSACLGRAVLEDVIPGNPCVGLRALRHRVERPRALTEREVLALLDAAHTPRDRRIIALMGYAGLRPAEALAVEWQDIAGGLIHVTRSLLSDGTVSTPKGFHGRTVRVTAALAGHLDHHAGGDKADLVAPARHGGPLNYRAWYRHVWKPLRARAGVTCAPYDLRHTFASRRIAEGATVVEVASEMGHTDPALTLRRYAHLFDRARHATS